MSNKIIYRKYQQSDFDDMLNITLKTWEYEKYVSKDIARLAAELDLLCYLRESSYIYVAQSDDKVIGFIIARNTQNDSDSSFDERINEIKELLSKRKEGIIIALFRWKMSRINNKLYKKANQKYDAELQFFAIDKKYRNLGLGKELFKMFNNYLTSINAESFYLYTDTTCNYGYYDRYGLAKRETEKFKIPFSKRPIAEFYLYDNLK